MDVELREAINRHDFDHVKRLHALLAGEFQWTCDGEAMKEAVEAGNDLFIAWHLTHCTANEASWLVPLAAANDLLGVMEHLWTTSRGGGSRVIKKAILTAVKGGRIFAVHWLHATVKKHWPKRAMDVAAEYGRLDIVEFLHTDRKEGFTTNAMDRAARKGHLDLVKWLHENRTEGCSKAISLAARHGHLAVVQWLHANRPEGCSREAMILAAQRGHVHIAEWLYANRTKRCTELVEVATTVKSDKTEKRNATTDIQAILAKHPELKQYRDEMIAAFEANDEGLIAWSLIHRTKRDVRVLMKHAAKCGRIGFLEYVKTTEPRIFSDSVGDSIREAAKGGCLEVMLHANVEDGWTTRVMDLASEHGRLEIVEYLHSNRTEGCSMRAKERAAKNGHLHLIKWLSENRSEAWTPAVMDYAAEMGHLEIVRWLHFNRTEGCSTKAMDRAAEFGYLNVVQWLHTHRTEGCTQDAMDGAVRNSNWETLEWLVQNRSDIKCTVEHLHAAIQHCQIRTVKVLYDQDELESWPRPAHASILLDLFQSDVSILMHIVNMRKQRYRSAAANNPVFADHVEANSDRNPMPAVHVLTSSLTACQSNGFTDLPKIVSEFLACDPPTVCTRDEAIERGWVHWLFCFSERPSIDVELLGECDQLDNARALHSRLYRHGRLHCSKRFMYLTMDKGDIAFVKWHMLNCEGHSFEMWLYTAVWTGRIDVVEWMLQSRSEVMSIVPDPAIASSNKRKTMFHSLDASFATVGALSSPT